MEINNCFCMDLNTALAKFLQPSLFIMFLLSFFLLAFLIYKAKEEILKLIRPIRKNTWLLLGVIVLLAAVLRFLIATHQHMTHTDEVSYMQAAKNILTTFSHGDYVRPVGWPAIIALFSVFGISSYTALYLSSLLGTLTIIVFFFLTYAFFKKEKIALVASLSLALLPIHILWSGSAETNISAVLFGALSLFFSVLYFRKQSLILYTLALSACLFASKFRPENYMFFIIFYLGEFIYSKKLSDIFKSKKIIVAIIIALLALPSFIVMMDRHSATDWVEATSYGAIEGDNWSLKNLVKNSYYYGTQELMFKYSPILITFCFLLGAFLLFMDKKKDAIFLIGSFIVIWLLYFISWFNVIAGRSRCYLLFFIIMFMLSSYAIINFSFLFSQKRRNNLIKILIILLIISFVIKFPQIDEGVNNVNHLTTTVPKQLEKDIPENCLVITKLPETLVATNLETISVEDFIYNNTKQNDCIYFYEEMFCLYFDSRMKSNCKILKKEYNLTLNKTYSSEEIEFYLYKVTKP